MATTELHDLDGNIIKEELSLKDKISQFSSNFFQSWKNLPKQNKMSGAYLVLFVLIMPVTMWAVGQKLNLFPKAAPLSLPITNPITLPYNSPTPTSIATPSTTIQPLPTATPTTIFSMSPTPTPVFNLTPTLTPTKRPTEGPTPTPTIIRQLKHSISGKVTYQIGRFFEIPAPNVQITIQNINSKNTQISYTNLLGKYQAIVLQTGTYQVTPKSNKNTGFIPTSRLARVADFDAAGVDFKAIIKKIIGIF